MAVPLNDCNYCFEINITIEFFDEAGEIINSAAEFVTQTLNTSVGGAAPYPFPIESNFFNSSSSHTVSIGKDGGYYNCSYDVDYSIRKVLFYLPDLAESVKIIYNAKPATVWIANAGNGCYENMYNGTNNNTQAVNDFTRIVNFELIRWK